MTIYSLEMSNSIHFVSCELKFRHGISKMKSFVTRLGCTGSVPYYFLLFFECSKFCYSFEHELPLRSVHFGWLDLGHMFIKCIELL